jgi:hypothetical protein
MVQKAVPKLLAEIGKESLPIVALGMAAVLHAFYAALSTAHDHESSQRRLWGVIRAVNLQRICRLCLLSVL